jgi:hypothetical protein
MIPYGILWHRFLIKNGHFYKSLNQPAFFDTVGVKMGLFEKLLHLELIISARV